MYDKNFNLRTNKEYLEILKEIGEKKHVSVNTMINYAIENFLPFVKRKYNNNENIKTTNEIKKTLKNPEIGEWTKDDEKRHNKLVNEIFEDDLTDEELNEMIHKAYGKK